jgi:DNA polymerase-3 subunit epsilon
MNNRFAIIDIETTGSYSAPCGITEIAILVHDTVKVIDTFETLINPGSRVLPFVTRLTGITNEMLYDAPRFEEVAKKIWQMTEDAVFVAHSVNFDYFYVQRAFKSLGADFRRKKLCTIRLSRKIFPGQSSYSLGNICTHLGIDITNRHRAMGDAAATVRLFEKCLQHDDGKVIEGSLKKNSLEATLPPHLPKNVFESLPEKTGVYYFHDQHGKIIYVGKAINIKKRIYSHITGKGARLSFLSSIANVTYKLCGTELIALLLESDEIKKLYPIYNISQKHSRGNYILTEYTDLRGVRHIQTAKNHPSLKAITSFRSFDAARSFMSALIEKFKLCPKYCGLQSANGACFHYQVKKCKGVCVGHEQVSKYNKRVLKALHSVENSAETKMIIDQGRAFNEKSVVVIEKGIYKGFGYFDAAVKMETIEQAKEIISPFKHTADVQKILNLASRQAQQA